MQRVLHVLSYFIRCSDLQEITQPPGHTDCPVNPCPPQTTNSTLFSEGTNENALTPESEPIKPVLRAYLDSTDFAAASEKISESGSAEFLPFPERTKERLLCTEVGPECLGDNNDSVEAGLEHILASVSPPVQRAQFTIGSPTESKHKERCGRGSQKKLPHRLLMGIPRNQSSDSSLGDSDEEELSPQKPYAATETREYELPLSG